MSSSFVDVCRFTAVSNGTGDFVVSSAVTGYQTPASAGAINAEIYSYRAESADLSQWEIGYGAYAVSGTTLSRTSVLFNSSGTTSKISFSSAPQVAIVALAEDFVRNQNEFRQNVLLDRIYLSKALGDTRREVNAWATGFKAATDTLRGINAGSSSNYDVTNAAASGYVSPTVTTTRNATGTASAPNYGGTAANANDNTPATLVSAAITTPAGTDSQRIFAQIDYGSTKTFTKIEAVNYYFSAGSGTIQGIYYSTNGTTWTLAGKFAASTSPVSPFYTGSFSARYVAVILDATAFSVTVNLGDLNAYEDIVSNMTMATASQTADVSVSNGRVLIEFDNTATPTLNTDLTAEISLGVLTATVTITNASPGVVSHTAHGMSAGDPVTLTTSGALPTGLTAGTTYFVSGPTTNAYSLAATPGGTAINTSSAGSGTHTSTYRVWIAASLSSVTAFSQGSRKVVESVDQAATGGTSFAARIKTLNNKIVPIYGASLTVH